ncbi:hypothetical protein TWF506_010637 [Arthrobotrys conoides]|uniref:Uncharacterized protein n=1 Tax=Arthrobotrys conoides TaxID=74498 RepID=A0AAN8NE57_9PEZI
MILEIHMMRKFGQLLFPVLTKAPVILATRATAAAVMSLFIVKNSAGAPPIVQEDGKGVLARAASLAPETGVLVPEKTGNVILIFV